jgi:hypothetical protein
LVKVKTPWVAFLDDDDCLPRTTSETLIDGADSSGADPGLQ